MSEAAKQRDFTAILEDIFVVKKNVLHEPSASTIRKLSKDLFKYFEGNSKTGRQGVGLPDFLYFNPYSNLVVIGEVKKEIIYHGDEKNDISKMTELNKYAINDLIHYMRPFISSGYHVIGLAMSGDVGERYLLDTFAIVDSQIVNKDIDYFYEKENDYLNMFLMQDTENAITRINKTLKVVNNDLRDIPSQDRPTLLAGVIISLYSNEENNIQGELLKQKNKYPNEPISWKIIKQNLASDIETVLAGTNIPISKIKIVKNEVSKTLTHNALRNTDVLPILIDEMYSVMGILTQEYEFDIMASFYQEFLSYATGDGQDLGIVLTPQHITELMVELLEIFSGGIRENDVVLDPCLGTGTFLTSYMDHQIKRFAKKDKIKQENIKKNNLIGLEISNSMFTLAVANMLVRGDGKAQLMVGDFFKETNFTNNKSEKAKFGLMNPPYSQSKKDTGNNYSEMEFIERLLDNIHEGYAAVIVPKSTLFKTGKGYSGAKRSIFRKHTLKAVIGMPNDLFEPTASTHTAIAIFMTNKSHQKNDEVYFYNLRSDGFDLNKGLRKNIRGVWEQKILPDLLKSVKQREIIESRSIIIKNLKHSDEWLPDAWLPVDFSELSNRSNLYDNTIREYGLFKFMESSGILKEELNIINAKDKDLRKRLKAKSLKISEISSLAGINSNNVLEILEEKKPSLNTKQKTELELFENNLVDFVTKRKLKNIDNQKLIKEFRRSLLIEEAQFNLNDVEWSLFKLTDYFTVKGTGQSYTSINEIFNIDGSFNYITTKASLNGVMNKTDIYSNKGNVITIDSATEGFAFYQDKNFISSDHVEKLVPLFEGFNVYIGLFIATILNKSTGDVFHYGRKRSQTRLRKEYIKLPINEEGTPNWSFIENFIKERASIIYF